MVGPYPQGDTWHLELFERFCEPAQPPIPLLFDKELESAIDPFRRFRHVVHHGYSFQLDWDRMHEGMQKVRSVFERFRAPVEAYLQRAS